MENKRALCGFLFAILGLIFLFVHSQMYFGFIPDDALISLQYAKRLSQGYGLTWTEGKPVEGYSNLLWVLGLAAIHPLSQSWIDSMRGLGFLCMGLAVAALYWLFVCTKEATLLSIIYGISCLALSGCIAAWTAGGLEQPLLACLLSWMVVTLTIALRRQPHSNRLLLASGIFAGLLCLTRPDSPIFVAISAIIILLVCPRDTSLFRPLCCFIAPAIFCIGAQQIFRVLYYGEWVPNTALIKIIPSKEHLLYGLRYLWRGYAPIAPIAALGFIGGALCLSHKSLRCTVLYCTAMIVAWTAYMLLIGGDVNPPSRHFVPIIVLISVLVMQVFCVAHNGVSLRYRTELMILSPLLFIVYFFQQVIDVENTYARTQTDTLRSYLVGNYLKQAFGKFDPLVAVDQAGWPVFWGDFRAIDMAGLNDHFIARNPSSEVGSGWIAHEHGNGEYVLSRDPDLIIFCSPIGVEGGGTCFPSGAQMIAAPGFESEYPLVRMEVGVSPPLQLWHRVKRYGGKLGIKYSVDRMHIPGYFFASSDGAGKMVLIDGQPHTKISSGGRGVLKNLRIASGTWNVHLYSSAGEKPAAAVLVDGAQVAVTALAPNALSFSVDQEKLVAMEILAEQETLYIQSMLLERAQL